MCNCGKRRMAKYSSKQLQRQASGGEVTDAAVVASSTGESDATSPTGQSAAPLAAAPRV